MPKEKNNALTEIEKILGLHNVSEETARLIYEEKLLSAAALRRLHDLYPQWSRIFRDEPPFFGGKERFSGLSGFHEIIDALKKKGVNIGGIDERAFFIRVYRFMATRHILNQVDWRNYANDPLFHLVFPQPGMIDRDVITSYLETDDETVRQRIVRDYIGRTNPYDGKQKLNKPWFVRDDGSTVLLKGSQHKYPQVQLVFDKQAQNCFAFCSYCFRHAQVRGDRDMFVQDDISQLHEYLKSHRETTDLLLTGGDAGYISAARLREYVEAFFNDPALSHVATVRLGSRLLSYMPERILNKSYDDTLRVFDDIRANGLRILWMAHFSTPAEILNPLTIAAIKRLQEHGVEIRSQSPLMRHISMFDDDDGKLDIERSAQNWIDLGNILARLQIAFHSMYCPRPTGEYRYFTASLADIYRVFARVYRGLASVNRPSRYISMTISAGKVSILGTVTIGDQKAFVLKFTEGRDMKWLDHVFLAQYDENTNNVAQLRPFGRERFFYSEELVEIEERLSKSLERATSVIV